MCDNYCNCSVCGYDKSLCDEMGDGSPFCSMFVCTIENCNRFGCISYDELYEIYHPEIFG